MAVFGLGNPGSRYERTRHNIGFRVADAIVRARRAARGAGCEAYAIWWAGDDRSLCVVKPSTYMNRCGEAARALIESEGVPLESLLVVVDDVNLPLGAVRLRGSGTEGGHNGLGSLIEALGTEGFPRLRLGVGPRPDGIELRDFVLSEFAPEEGDDVKALVERGAGAAIAFAEGGLEAAMREFNRREVREEE